MRSALRRSMRVAAALAASVGACRPAPAQTGEIFREVNVGAHQSITLGMPLRADVLPLLSRLDAHRLKLKPGMFSGAAHITVHLGGDGRVRCLAFDYPPGFSYADHARGYEQDLGAPASRTGAEGDAEQATRWEDARTAFTVSRRGAEVRSLLCDRASTADTARTGGGSHD